MRKLKLYLDTSVISYLGATDAPEKTRDTFLLWEDIKDGKYEVFLSDVTLAELDQCKEEQRRKLLAYLEQIEYNKIVADARVRKIADRFVELGILRPKSYDDCQHIAAAIIGGCDIIVSWNFKHIVNYKTIQGAKAVAALEGVADVLIFSPSVLIGGEPDDP